MKVQGIRALTALIVVAFTSVVVPAKGSEVRTPAFTIDLPAGFPAFETRHDVQKTGESAVETTTWISRSPGTTEAVIVAVSTMAGKIVNVQKLLDKTRDALLTSVKGTLDADEPSSQVLPGRRLMIRAPGAFIRARLMVSGKNLYQVLYVARSSDQLASNDVANVFASLRVSE